jgi:hypothetical protein
VRDDFSAKTIRILAARVGYHCSNPTCVSSTSGPALDEDRAVNVGVGAHITAASAQGPRYDAKMTPAERISGSNGIWLCPSCSKLIDSDENRYTVALLHQWKNEAIERALDAIARGRPLGSVKASSAFDAADEEFLRGLICRAAKRSKRLVCGFGRPHSPIYKRFGQSVAGPRERWPSRCGWRKAPAPT